jgi:predicted PurR-regulated permease PerM
LGGTQVLGIIGALIVPPWVAGAAVLLENLYLKPKQLAEQQEETILTSLTSPTAETSSALPVNR